ncbi:MAG: glycosyltransferase [Pseudomonadota bacterium]
MTKPEVSVVVVSQGRPDDLALCLTALHQQQAAPAFEIIIVGDAQAQSAVARHVLADCVTVIRDDTPNISLLRNLGIAQASAPIVAFIDDDAIALPYWLSRLTTGFADPRVQATGGYVRKPDGVSYQWTQRVIRTDGRCVAPAASDAHRPIKLEGTNMAVRRSWFVTNGGFDQAFAFYLDETDLCLRLVQSNAAVILCDDADVIHGFSASPRRRGDRVPHSLHDLGTSLAVFLQKWHPQPDHAAVFARFRADQRKRLLRWMVAGLLEPRDVSVLLRSLQAGWQNGQTRPSDVAVIGSGSAAQGPICPPRYMDAVPHQFSGHIFRRSRLMRRAATKVQTQPIGVQLSAIFLKRSWLRLTESGVWVSLNSEKTPPSR